MRNASQLLLIKWMNFENKEGNEKRKKSVMMPGLLAIAL